MAIKLKQVSFNTEFEDQKNLLDSINESDLNFAHETKKMWAERLEVDYTKQKQGRKESDNG